MARADYLELGFGATGWNRGAHLIISLLGAVAVLISPGSWGWKLLTFSTLATAYILIKWNMGQPENRGVIRVFQDGTAMLSTQTGRRIFGTLAEHQWVSPWLCSVAIYPAKGGWKRFLVVNRTNNDADEYRRLLKFLRMRPRALKADRMIW